MREQPYGNHEQREAQALEGLHVEHTHRILLPAPHDHDQRHRVADHE